MKKVISLGLAAVMSASVGVYAFADTSAVESDEVKSALAEVKARLNVPEEYSEFSYSKGTSGFSEVYTFNWSTPVDGDVYGCVSCSYCNGIIMDYSYYSSDKSIWSNEPKLAEKTKTQLYAAAVKAVKKLNPTVAEYISIDKGSLSMSVYGSSASFGVSRTYDGIPVANDVGSITIDKNTGELLSFSMSWHQNASFRSSDGTITEDKAWEKYGEMISIAPRYELYYDSDKKEMTSRLVYVQSDFGEINAFTGIKSNFEADAYYNDFTEGAVAEDASAELDTGGVNGSVMFTEQELAELGVELPYATEQAVIKLVSSNDYLTYSDGMTMQYSYLTKQTQRDGTVRYLFTISFSNETEEQWDDDIIPYENDTASYETENDYEYMHICLDAQTGDVLSYGWNSSAESDSDSYSITKADTLAKKVAKSLAPSYISEYTDYSSIEYSYTNYDGKTTYFGSGHTFGRTVNNIPVSGNTININFDTDMKLTQYDISYDNVDFADPAGMLTAEQALERFREQSELNLYYLARTSTKRTATVLVYGTDSVVYCDAFTGDQIYGGSSSNDLSGITDPNVLKLATTLTDNGITISAGKFSETDAVTQSDFARFANLISGSGLYDSYGSLVLPSGKTLERNGAEALTRGDAMVIYTTAVCGSKISELKGIFRSPFTDVGDDDKNIGCYAIAYALGAVSGTEMKADEAYTYGDLINLMYNSLR